MPKNLVGKVRYCTIEEGGVKIAEGVILTDAEQKKYEKFKKEFLEAYKGRFED